MVQPRIFAGQRLRELRSGRGLRQSKMAELIGISPAYLSQLENDDRPLSPALIDRLQRRFPSEWQDIPIDTSAELLRAFHQSVTTPSENTTEFLSQVRRIVEQFPNFTAQFIALSNSHRENIQRLGMLDDAIGSDNNVGGRLPWEEVRDWFHDMNNYIDSLDQKAEGLSESISRELQSPSTEQMIRWLAANGIAVRFSRSGPVREFAAEMGALVVNTAKTHDSTRFHLAWQIANTKFGADMSAIARDSVLRSDTSRKLLEIGLRNYMAGAILMPYERFRAAARTVRHDIDQLRHIFGTTFEQVCHRLSTLQRPGARGIPMYFCRVDMAGNITKRHSATRLRFARFGGACPLWVVHEAVAVSHRIHVQLAEMPDRVRYVSIAKGLVKETGNYSQRPRRYAVALGCEADYASEFVYADELNLESKESATPLGISCRICPREDCDQRAFPPSDKEITVDLAERDIVPYRIVRK